MKHLDAFLVTPPFTQLNTPYPATAYLTGYLSSVGFIVDQDDWSIRLFHEIFNKDVLTQLFDSLEGEKVEFQEVWVNREAYLNKVDVVINYLRAPETTGAHLINQSYFLPKGHRYNEEFDFEYSFGNLGVEDKAKHLATLFIEEIGDFITANLDEDFGFTRYAEKLLESSSSFDDIESRLQEPLSWLEQLLIGLVEECLSEYKMNAIIITVPFPGNLLGALRIGQFIKGNTDIKVILGGGYCNTELRDLTDSRIFKYIDYITLDDGEGPLKSLLENLRSDNFNTKSLERTFCLEEGSVVYKDRIPNQVILQKDIPAPSYKGLPLDQYVSFLDVVNPMHRLWSDGRWNKLTVAHGCYWKQCSFCDVSLAYIGDYQQSDVNRLVDHIEQLIEETGLRGFHFVDEAAPPKVLKALAEEIIKRGVLVTWWTNIRFEKTFTPEVCKLLAKSGCIAVTGGLEVASDRLLQKMKKGVSIEQVSKVTAAFADEGIMVHAYLMYGFPTQTDQETIDALEVVRQLIGNGCIHSAFWHRFSTTAHSPIGMNPEEFDIEIQGSEFAGFAKNDLYHSDPKGANHDQYTFGLNKALYNYMQGIGLDEELQYWFDFRIKSTQLPHNLIENYILG